MAARPAGAHTGVRLPYLLAAPIAIFVVVFLIAQCAGSVLGSSSQDTNLFVDRPPFAVKNSAAMHAAETSYGDQQDVLRRLASVPTAVWLTPEAYSPSQVSGVVKKAVAGALVADRTAVLVVYGITNRDCSGGESSGGLPPEQYKKWVQEISDSAGAGTAVILEPDALATAVECGQVDQRTNLLKDALDELVDGGSTVYVDAGHSNWTPPAEMAAMLSSVGIESARGFSTNVAGYESVEDEQAYAEAIASQLPKAHYVIDTSRNGVGSSGEWCNPAGRALGREPEASTDGRLDAYLWIKPPGESDGECGGGPVAGTFWIDRALELAANAGW